jgi:phosphoribosylaminoimidazolecarboxamide formyltransferase/IMP cyclohydrolase
MHPAKSFPTPDLVRVRRALISVSDKAGLEAFAAALVERGVELISTGGTAKALAAAGLPVRSVDALTGFPEILDGRVKTLHPKVHGGLLAVRDDPAHAAAMKQHHIEPIDLVCINLYPFEQTVARPGVSRHEAIENIDVGGPAMVRASAKNHAYVAILTNPRQYGAVLAEMQVTDGCTSREMREQLAREAFALTARYDAAVAEYLAVAPPDKPARHSHPPHPPHPPHAPARPAADAASTDDGPTPSGLFPPTLSLSYIKGADLRYGENPHQPAAVYTDPGFDGPSVVSARQLHGKELSYNNLHDADAALGLAIALAQTAGEDATAACVIKHANPCGAAIAGSARAAVDRAIAGDPLAAFGGIVALWGVVDEPAAARLCEKDIFLEVLIAREFAPAALDALRARWANLRLLALGSAEPPAPARPAPGSGPALLQYKPIRGGLLAQAADTLPPDPGTWQHQAGPAPSAGTLRAAAAIECMVRAMNSNAVALGSPDPAGGPDCVRLVGGGLGQVDRLQACKIAVEKAGPLARGAIAVSDAFFPFPDGPRVLIDAGVSTIVHPGGSKRDQETFDLCQQHGVTCLVTGVRRFKH